MKQNDLLATFQRTANGRQQGRRERSVHQLAPAKVFHIYHLYLWQSDVFVSRGKFNMAVLARLRVVISFCRRRCRAQKRLRAIVVGQHDGRRTGMITRRGVLLFETSLVLFVDDDQPKTLKRQKHGTPCAQYYLVGLGRKLLFPYLHPFGIAVSRMVNAQAFTKHTFQARGHLHGQCYFGQQVKHLFLLFQGFADEMDIHLGFTAGCYAVQQHHSLFEKLEHDAVIRLLLCCAQRFGLFGGFSVAGIQSSHLLIIYTE